MINSRLSEKQSSDSGNPWITRTAFAAGTPLYVNSLIDVRDISSTFFGSPESVPNNDLSWDDMYIQNSMISNMRYRLCETRLNLYPETTTRTP